MRRTFFMTGVAGSFALAAILLTAQNSPAAEKTAAPAVAVPSNPASTAWRALTISKPVPGTSAPPRPAIALEKLRALGTQLGRALDIACDLFSDNEAELLSKNKTALLSGNSPTLLSGNAPKVLSGNQTPIFSGNSFSLLSNIKVEIHIENSGNNIQPPPAAKTGTENPR